ncbi:MAG: glycosyltransferase family 1 protein [Acetobacteraceae bacterium]|nr:glycosyltransferase family 1 protein [Acetobacteraceae bacterium]
MRILIVSDAWEPQVNGVVRTMRTVLHELRKMGHVAEVIGPDRFVTVPLPSYPSIRLALKPRRRLNAMLQAFAPNALHISTEGPLGWAARAWALRVGMPFTTAFHTRFPEYLRARTGAPVRFSYAVLRRFHRPAQGTLVAAESLRRELVTRGFRNIRSWSRGVDIDLFRPEPHRSDGPERPLSVYVGRIAVEKNIRAFLDMDLPGTKMVVGDGPQLASLRRDYPKVVFVGERHGAALASAYAQADLFVFPSLTDTFGLVLLEALACGTPVAAFPVTGPIDLLTGHPEVGATDWNLRRACLAALGCNRSACRSFAERFSWRACAEAFLRNLAVVPARPPIAQTELEKRS